MIWADNTGDAYHHAMDHSPWNNVTLADFVFPFFLFITGLSLPLSLKKYRTMPGGKWEGLKKIADRFCKLFMLGVILQGGGFPDDYNLKEIRIWGILQRIGLCWALAALVEVFAPQVEAAGEGALSLYRRYAYHWLFFLGFMALYLGLLFGVKTPNCDQGPLSQKCNSCGYIDRKIFGQSHLYARPTYRRSAECKSDSPPSWCDVPFDPEGFVSTFSAVCSTILGLQFGHAILLFREHPERLRFWIPLSLASLIIGIVINFSGFPFNKNIYTTSYMFMMGGVAGFVFVIFYYYMDIRDGKIDPLKWVGMNGIFVFVFACDLLQDMLTWVHYGSPKSNIVVLFRDRWLMSDKFLGFSGGIIAFTVIKITFWIAVAWYLQKKGLFYKI